jgi:hypothetical protein
MPDGDVARQVNRGIIKIQQGKILEPSQASLPPEILFKKDPSNDPSSNWESRQVYFCTNAGLRILHQDREAFMNGEVERPFDED